ncbi:MAG: hypothetical protein PHQ53_02860 [Candidatus Krumholzibacteria bacterium]|nr:hypothetical protein [Candidatus Krumholzibacteria bacterium]
MKNLKLIALVLIAAAFLFAGYGCAPAAYRSRELFVTVPASEPYPPPLPWYSSPYPYDAVSPVVPSSTQDARHTPLAIKHDAATDTRATPVTKPGSRTDNASTADNRSGSRDSATSRLRSR